MPHGDDDTIPLDPSYREVVVENGRMFQEYSLINRVYCVPIDEVILQDAVYMQRR